MTAFMRVAAIAASLALVGPGCAQDARMALPMGIEATTERLVLSGLGSADRGDVRLGASIGRFTRTAIRTEDPTGFEQRNVGGSSFEIEGPEFDRRLAAHCRYREVEHIVGAVAGPIERFAYRCRFERNGRPIDAGLILEELPSRPGKLLSGRTRGGEIHLDGRVATIHAIHDMEGGRLPAGDALGYAFEAGGRTIGAVDINGGDKTIHAPRDGPDRELVLAASLALAILWDPAG